MTSMHAAALLTALQNDWEAVHQADLDANASLWALAERVATLSKGVVADDGTKTRVSYRTQAETLCVSQSTVSAYAKTWRYYGEGWQTADNGEPLSFHVARREALGINLAEEYLRRETSNARKVLTERPEDVLPEILAALPELGLKIEAAQTVREQVVAKLAPEPEAEQAEPVEAEPVEQPEPEAVEQPEDAEVEPVEPVEEAGESAESEQPATPTPLVLASTVQVTAPEEPTEEELAEQAERAERLRVARLERDAVDAVRYFASLGKSNAKTAVEAMDVVFDSPWMTPHGRQAFVGHVGTARKAVEVLEGSLLMQQERRNQERKLKAVEG